jgi:hypothetical protein
MIIDTDKTVSMTEANQNFSKVHEQDFPGSRAEPRRFCGTICGIFGN